MKKALQLLIALIVAIVLLKAFVFAWLNDPTFQLSNTYDQYHGAPTGGE